MRKTSIYIPDEVDRALTRRAAIERTSKAELIRQALSDAASSALQARPRACGVFDGPADLASEADRHLEETGFGES